MGDASWWYILAVGGALTLEAVLLIVLVWVAMGGPRT